MLNWWSYLPRSVWKPTTCLQGWLWRCSKLTVGFSHRDATMQVGNCRIIISSNRKYAPEVTKKTFLVAQKRWHVMTCHNGYFIRQLQCTTLISSLKWMATILDSVALIWSNGVSSEVVIDRNKTFQITSSPRREIERNAGRLGQISLENNKKIPINCNQECFFCWATTGG